MPTIEITAVQAEQLARGEDVLLRSETKKFIAVRDDGAVVLFTRRNRRDSGTGTLIREGFRSSKSAGSEISLSLFPDEALADAIEVSY